MSNFLPTRFDPGALRGNAPKLYPCRVAGCENLRGTTKLVCMTCWWRIPEALRVEVSEAWRAYLRRPSRATGEAYRDAKARALEAAAQKVGA